MFSKDYNVFIYISKNSMSLVINAFKRLQCLHLHFKDINHLRFQKTTMSSFTFQRLQCLQSFMLSKTTMSLFTFQRLQCLQSFTLSKDYNVFIYILKTSMSFVIYVFKRLQCLHLHFKEFNVFSH